MIDSLPTKDRRRIETGFAAFFDILGYGSFLESGITEITFKVIDILEQLPNRLQEAQTGHYGIAADSGTSIRRQMEQIIPLVVSDSVLLRYAYDERRDPSERPSQAATFVVAATVLQRMMFEEGLPLRGAIAFGSFIFAGHVFAGKPIIDAHKLGDSLDLAACAVHPTAEDEFRALATTAPDFEGFLSDGESGPRLVVRYPTPMKGGEHRELPCLNIAWPTLKGYVPLKDRKDLRRYVEEKFSAHNKKVGENVLPKIENTEKFLRFLSGRFAELFNRDP